MPEISQAEIKEVAKISDDKEIKSPLKNDPIDLEISRRSSLGYKSIAAGGAISTLSFLGLMADKEYRYEEPLELAALTGVALLTSAAAGSSWYSMRKEASAASETIYDKKLGYDAARLIYKGNNPIEIDGKKHTKGDNYLYVRLPSLTQDSEKSNADLQLRLELFNHSLRDIRKFACEREYDFVVFENSEEYDDANILSPQNVVKKSKLLAGKKAEIKETETNVNLFSKEQFESLTTSIDEIFEKLTKEFDDPLFSEYISLAKGQSSGNKLDLLQRRMTSRLDSVLRRELETNFNALPEVVMTRVGDNMEPIRRKVYTQSYVKQTEKGLTFIQTNTATGEIRYIPIEQLLKTKSKSIDELIHMKSHLKKGSLALVLRGYIEESDLNELLNPKHLSKDELIEKLEEKNHEIAESEPLDSDVGKSELSHRGKTILKNGLSGVALTTALITAASATSIGADFIFHGPGYDTYNSEERGSSVEASVSTIGFPNDVPKSGIEWMISGNMPSSGYYITGTSNEFEDKRWKPNEEVEKVITIPEINEKQKPEQYLSLYRPTLINQFGETSFKIPIRENTKLHSISLTDPDGKLVERSIKQLEDGSLEVEINGSIINMPAYVDINADFIPNERSQIHATSPIKQIDESKLSEDAKNDLYLARNSNSDVDAIEILRRNIATEHLYSINPPDKNMLEEAKTKEEVVNAIENLSACSCEVCNTQLALTSSLVSKDETINMAYGYIAMDNGITGNNDNYLKTETRHAFGIQQNGYVVDATATSPADDELTQSYLDMLKRNHATSDNQEEDAIWDYYFEDLKNSALDAKSQADFLKLVGGLLTGGAGLLVGRQVYKKGSKIITAENVEKVSNNIIADVVDKKSLGKAFIFFNWLSWGKPEFRMDLNKPVDGKNNADIFNQIRDSISYDKIAQYSEDPASFEKVARKHGFSLTKLDKIKFRLLANYLLNS